MKKWILSAAFLLAMSGFAAAQTKKTQEVSKTTTQKTAVKKGTTQKTNEKKETNNTTSANAVAVIPKKLNIVLPAVDTTGVPVKN